MIYTERPVDWPYAMWLHAGSMFVFALGLVVYCGFAALHSTQRVESPTERSKWLILTIGLNLLGSCWYYCTKYQQFRKEGKGALMRARNEAKLPKA